MSGADSGPSRPCLVRSVWRSARQLTPLPAVTRRNLDGSPLALNSSICGYGCRRPARLCRPDCVHNQEEVRVVLYTIDSQLISTVQRLYGVFSRRLCSSVREFHPFFCLLINWLTMLLANITRCFFRLGERFEFALLLQSLLTILCQVRSLCTSPRGAELS